MALFSKREVPKLVLAQRVVDKMANAASRFIEDETGEALVGLVIDDKVSDGPPTIFVLDTISPDETAVRQLHTFQQGDDLQDEIIWWLQENWAAVRRMRQGSYGSAVQAKWDAPLQYLGDWHKQPGFMIKPSFGDLMTAVEWVEDDDNGMPFLLVPIVTLGHPSTTSSEGEEFNYITVPMGDDTDMRVDFWYLHRDVRMFQPMHVSVWADDKLPGLTKYPWHLAHGDRYKTEAAQLQGDGLFTSVVLWNADEKVPLEVCFLVARRGADKVLIIVTAWDYPRTAPYARAAPFVQMGEDDNIYDIFEQLWKKSTKVKDPAGWKWTEESYLVDYIHALEGSLGLRPEPPVKPPTRDITTDLPGKVVPTDETKEDDAPEEVKE